MRKRKIVKIIVALTMMFTMTASPLLLSSAATLSEAQQEKEALEKSLADAKKVVAELQNSKKDTQQKVDALNKQLKTISNQVDALETKLNTINTQISDSELSLQEAEENEKAQYENMKLRIKYTYENGKTSYLNAIFGAKDMTSFINAVEYATMMTNYDRNKMEEYQNNQVYIAETKESLKQQYAEAETMKADIAKQEEAVQMLVSAKQEELGEVSEDLTDAQAVAKVYEQEVQAQNEVLAQIQAALKAEQTAEDAGATDSTTNTPSVSAAGFIWPCPAYTRVSSDFGPRPSPTAGASTVHKGIDLAAPYGSNILAAQAGKVIISVKSESAGNYVAIDHGKDSQGRTVVTVYMHASSRLVSVGDTVTQGQVIAKVGSTGYSTGNHLHFGVSLDSTYVSPWNYVSKP